MIVVALILALAASESPVGSIFVSSIQILPNLINFPSALLSISFSLENPIPSQDSEIIVTSPYRFTSNPNRNDCYLSTPGVSIKSCRSDGNSLVATITAGTDFDIDSGFELTVLKAFSLPGASDNTTAFQIVTMWGENEEVNRNNTAGFGVLCNPETINGTASFLMAMEYEFTKFNVTLLLPILLGSSHKVFIYFPSGFDPLLGRVKAEGDQLVLSCSIPDPLAKDLSPKCYSEYQSIRISFSGSSGTKNITFTINDFRMPSNLPSDTYVRTVVTENGKPVYQGNYWVDTTFLGLDTACCNEYNEREFEQAKCEFMDLNVCLMLGFNMAQFSEDGNSLNVYFRHAINIAEFQSCGKRCDDCRNIVTNETLASLGYEPQCRWIDYDQLVINLGSMPTIFRGDYVSFDNTVVRLNDTNEPLLPNRLKVINNKQLPLIRAKISMKGNVSLNTSALLDCLGTTGTGRWSVPCSWNINGTSYQEGSQIEIDKKYVLDWTKTELTVTLTTHNRWNKQSTVDILVPITRDTTLTVTFPFGDKVQFSYSNSFTFNPTVTSPAGYVAGQYTYTWRSNMTEIGDSCKNEKYCTVPAEKLPKPQYRISVEVRSGDYFGYANATVFVTQPKVQIIVIGGNRDADIDEPILLDGSKTVNPYTKRPILLTWRVRDTNITQTISTMLVIPPRFLEANRTYFVEVAIPKTASQAEIATVVMLNTTETPVVKITFLPSRVVNPFDIVRVFPIVDLVGDERNVACEWTQKSRHNYEFGSSATARILVLAPESLDPGLTYTFQYSCKFQLEGKGSFRSIAQTDIKVNNPPMGGEFTISPSSGIEMKTIFTFLAENWSDRDEDYPLMYQLYNKSGDAYLPFTPAYLSNNITSFLTRNYQSIVLYVCDSLSACSRSTQMVAVNPPENVANQLTGAFKVLNETKVASSDLRAVVSVCIQIGTFVGNQFADGNLSDSAAKSYLSTLVTTINSTVFELKNQSHTAFSTEDQESICSVVMKIVDCNAVDNTLLSHSINILNEIYDPTKSRYTTGSVFLAALSKLGDTAALTIAKVEDEARSDQVELSLKLTEFAAHVVGMFAGTLSVGQNPLEIREPAVSFYAIRNQSSKAKTVRFELSVFYGGKEGLYNVTLPQTWLDRNQTEMSERVYEFLIYTLKNPPAESLKSILPQYICAFTYSETNEELSHSRTCGSWSITSLWNLTTIFPTFALRDIGQYNASTGLITTQSDIHVSDELTISHDIPVVTRGNVECEGYDYLGQYSPDSCETKRNTDESITCTCSSSTSIQPISMLGILSSLSNFVKSPDIQALMFQAGEVNGGFIFVFVAIIVIVLIYVWFGQWDQSEKFAIEKLMERFEQATNKLMYELANHKNVSLEELISDFEAGKPHSANKLRKGIKSAVKTITESSENFKKCRVTKTFLNYLKSDAYLKQIVDRYQQYSLEIRDLSQSSGFTVHNRITVTTDDVIMEENYWAKIVWADQILALFFCLTTQLSRRQRIPILAITLLGPLVSYSANFRNYKRHYILGIKDLFVQSRTLFWNVGGWKATFTICAIFMLISFVLEQLVTAYIQANYIPYEIRSRFPQEKTKRPFLKRLAYCFWNRKAYFLCQLVPAIICFLFCVSAFISMTYVTNSTDLMDVLMNTLISFGVSVVVGFHFVALLLVFVWPVVKRWILFILKNVLWLLVRELLWVPARNMVISLSNKN